MKPRLSPIPVLLIISLLLGACGAAPYECIDPLGCLGISPGSPVVIGTILATSGDQRPAGTASLQNVEKAVADKGKLLGHPIKVLRYATDCSAGSAQVAATEFAINPDLAAVIGPTCTDEVVVAGQILLDAGIPLLGPVLDSRSAYALTNQIFAAIQKVAIQMPDKTIYIPRQALLKALNLSP
jgi:ABC-type branched-subunit amino acid transport system substrate-binding protein